MNKEKILKQTIEYVKNNLSGEGSGHDKCLYFVIQ